MNRRDCTNVPVPSASAPSSLGPETLARRLRELAGEERDVQVDFLLHLDEFDRRRAFLEAGHDSLWSYCLRELHLREGAAGRRIGAMRILRRFSALEVPLRDGRLCLSTVTLLAPLLTTENLDDLVSRAAYRTKAEVEHLVATVQPRVAPKDGIRRVAERCGPERQHPSATVALSPAPEAAMPSAPPLAVVLESSHHAPIEQPRAVSESDTAFSLSMPSRPAPEARRQEMRPVSANEWSLRVTIDGQTKADLEMLTSLVSHTAGGDLAAVLREAIRCGIEKHGKRRGAVKPARERAAGPAAKRDEPRGAAKSGDGTESGCKQELEARRSAELTATSRRVDPRAIPIAVRREVWLRDEGCCSWRGRNGERCRSRWKLEFDHIRPVARGGESTSENLRLVCRSHNVLHAEQTFGREHMARFGGQALFLEIAESGG